MSVTFKQCKIKCCFSQETVINYKSTETESFKKKVKYKCKNIFTQTECRIMNTMISEHMFWRVAVTYRMTLVTCFFLSVKGVKQKGEGLLPLNHASKTVDVPASLPTPPHNNQEELRYGNI